jgi:hypothetical protein
MTSAMARRDASLLEGACKGIDRKVDMQALRTMDAIECFAERHMSLPCSREDLIVLGCRCVAVFLCAWALYSLIDLPTYLYALAHRWHESFRYRDLQSYWRSLAVQDLAIRIAIIAISLRAAGWFYRCSQRLRHFLTIGS